MSSLDEQWGHEHRNGRPKRRRILQEIRLDKIAAVTRPCVEGATVAIIKRADAPDPDSTDTELDELKDQLATLDKGKRRRGFDADLEDMAEAGREERAANDDEEHDDDEPDGKVKKRHRFEAFVDRIAREEKVPRTTAMTRARQQYPELYASYVRERNVSKSYADLVQAEISRGCSPVVAAQRVAILNPDAARVSIAKARDEAADFMERVGSYHVEHGCARTVAMSEIRKRYPDAFERLQKG
jgi:hypothetical protein